MSVMILFLLCLIAWHADMNLEHLLRLMVAVAIVTFPIWATFARFEVKP